MNIVNQFSYILITGGSVALVWLVLRRLVHARVGVVIAVQAAVIAVFVAGFVVLRTGDGDTDDAALARAVIANDRPTFIEFFSNYCTGCLLLRPTVDQIVREIQDDYNVLRINIHTEAGRELRQQYNFSFTPEFLLLTANGVEVWRDHMPPDRAALALARQTPG